LQLRSRHVRATSLTEDGKQPFAAFVLEALGRREVELGTQWTEQTSRGSPAASGGSEPDDDGRAPGVPAGGVVRAVLALARDEGQSADAASKVGRALGAAAHLRNKPVLQMLEEIDRLEAVLLDAAERAAAQYASTGDGLVPRQAGLTVAGRISGAVSLVRLAATKGYTQTAESELRARYRTIRHDFRNSLGTIRSAIALLTDESLPPEMRESSRVRAMVVRNARTLDQMIGEALGDDAASLLALGAPRPVLPRTTGDTSDTSDTSNASDSARNQRDNLLRARQRPDLESGAL
jgi:hypothetical protein